MESTIRSIENEFVTNLILILPEIYIYQVLLIADGENNSGNDDAFLVKYDSSGTKQWTSLIGTSQGDRALGVSVSPTSSNVYLVGHTLGDLTSDSSGDNDYFLVKLNPTNGNEDVNWRIQKGSSAEDIAVSVDVATDGAIYVAGYTLGDLTEIVRGQ